MVYFIVFSWFSINKMRFLARNVCFRVLVTIISSLQQFFFGSPNMILDGSDSVGKNFSVTHKKQVLRYQCSFVTGIQFLYKQVSYDLD